jgi:serine/threonine protein kinase
MPDEGSESTTAADGAARARHMADLASAVHAALDHSLPSISSEVGRGGTIHLGSDYLTYARKKLSSKELKKELEARLAPVVARSAGPAPGQPFGKFIVRSFLGKGGMAEVFLATDPERDPAKGQDVALKVMRDDLAGEPAYVRRFLREAANAGMVDHPNVVGIHEIGAVLGRVYFTMELVEGATLKEKLAAGAMSELEGLLMLRQMVAGLVAVHERGIGHRDLKPSNIMLADPTAHSSGFEIKGDTNHALVKIMDFGLARNYADDDEPEVDAEGRILGTAKYVAPELIGGQPPTLKADVFSLGILAFQVFTGRAPWKAKNKMDYLEANLRLEAPPLTEFAPGASSELTTLVAAMLVKDPKERPDTASLLRDLDRLIERARTGKPIVVVDDAASVFFIRRGKRKARADEPEPRKIPTRALAILGTVVLVLVLVAIFVNPFGSSAPPPPPVLPPPPPPSIPPRKIEPKTPAEDELLPSKRPASLNALGSALKDEAGRAAFKRALEDGDRAWAASDFAVARECWQDALTLVGGDPRTSPLGRRMTRAERELALGRSRTAEAEGRTQDAIDALDEAEAKGAPPAAVDPSRTRLRLRRTDEQDAKDALSEVQANVAHGDLDAALARLEKATPAFSRLGREAEVRAKIRELLAEKDRRQESRRVEKLLDAAKASLDRDELDAAATALDSARAIDAGAPRLAALARRLARARRAPQGTAYFETDAASGKGLWVRAALVSNREWRSWLDTLPPGKRRAGPWVTGGFAPEDAEKPVRGVRPEEARAFAEARHERLASAAELDVLGKTVSGFVAQEGLPDARGVLGSGFRTVLDPPEERP